MLNDNQHVQGECAVCHFVYALERGYDCPRCHSTTVAWARLVTDQDYKQDLLKRLRTAQAKEYMANHPQRSSFHIPYHQLEAYQKLSDLVNMTEGEVMDYNELEKLYALEDKR